MKCATRGVLAGAVGAVLGAVPLAVSPAAASPDGAPPPVTQQLPEGHACVSGSTATTQGTPWQIHYLGLDDAGALSAGAGVTVAVLDTGIASAKSPRLSGRVSDGPSIAGPAGKDCVGHGTFVAGLIAGAPRLGDGFTGVAPAARLYSVAVTDRTGSTSPAALARGIEVAVAAGARVIDVSVPTRTPSAALALAVRHATAAGDLVVAPATVDDQTRGAPVYPAAYPGVLSVGDIDVRGDVPESAGIGAPVDLVAPGDGVIAPGLSGGDFAGSGASYATAYVAGTAALIDSYRGPMAPAALVHRLEATAVHPGTRLPDPRSGYGEIDPRAALSVIFTGESGAGPASGAVTPVPGARLTVPPAPDHASVDRGLAVAAGGLAVALLAGLTTATVVRGRRRGWRPGATAPRRPPEDVARERA